jgi:hypothetical protein
MSEPHTTFLPSESFEEALARAAVQFGIEREYWDIWGKHHVPPAEAIASVLRSLGVDASSAEALDRAVESRLWDEWSRLVPPTVVASVNDARLTLRTPAGCPGPVRVHVAWEGGSTVQAEVELNDSAETGTMQLRDQMFTERRIPLPFDPRLGYHDLTVTVLAAIRPQRAGSCVRTAPIFRNGWRATAGPVGSRSASTASGRRGTGGAEISPTSRALWSGLPPISTSPLSGSTRCTRSRTGSRTTPVRIFRSAASTRT